MIEKTIFEITTLVELLRWRATLQPNQIAYTFLVEGETEQENLTYAQLDQKAKAIANQIHALNLGHNQRALLLCPSGLDYIAAFFGCLYACVIAIPAYPPRRNRSDERLLAIATDAQASLVLTQNDIIKNTNEQITNTFEVKHWLVTDNWMADEIQRLSQNWQAPEVKPETLAFLQYTSGSTSTPKGVTVSHGNLLHNSAYTTSIWQEHKNQ